MSNHPLWSAQYAAASGLEPNPEHSQRPFVFPQSETVAHLTGHGMQLDAMSGFQNTFHIWPPHPLANDPLASYQVGSALSAPRQPQGQHCGPRSTGGSWFSRHNPFASSSSRSQDTEPCWRCKDCHKKCVTGTDLCQRCETSPGNSNIPCRRGPVYSTLGQLFFCHLLPPKGSSKARLPAELWRAAKFIDGIRRRYITETDTIESSSSGAGTRHSGLLVRVITTKVENINYFEPFKDLAGIRITELPYDGLISRIVWELEDNLEAAGLIGLGLVEDLVGFLEAASLCESQYGHYKQERRLVYNSMWCLSYCLDTLRLSSHGLLNPQPHSHCDGAGQCVSPGLRGLSRYAFRYVEALDKAIFHRDRRKSHNWLLIFYSLRIQCHVRRALMVLEQRQQPELMGSWASNASRYLWDAVVLFREISMQNRGKLAAKIRDSKAQPSVYLQQPQQRRSAWAGSSTSSPQSWEEWHEEGVITHLERIFDIPAITNTANHAPPTIHQQTAHPSTHRQVSVQGIHHLETPNHDDVDFNSDNESDSDSDSKVTVVGSPSATILQPAPLAFAGASASANNRDDNEIAMQMYCPTSPSSPFPRETPTPVPSDWSVTSFDPNSAAASFQWTDATFSPTASDTASMTTSRLSFLETMWDDCDFNALQFDNTLTPNDCHFYNTQ